MLRLTPRPLLAATLAGLALVLGGCVVFKVSPSADAPPLGPVTITTEICASNSSSGSPACTNTGNSGVGPADGGHYQVLLGYRVEAGAGIPDAIVATKIVGFIPRTFIFTRSEGYTAQLQALAPAPAGFQWVGYMSEELEYNTGDAAEQELTVAPGFEFPRNPSGEPFPGPFRYRAVVGAREVYGSHGPDRPVQCGSSLFSASDEDTTICVDDPPQAQFDSFKSLKTTDLGILPGGSDTAGAGTTASVPFVARYAGEGSTTLSIAATTDIPGATATPSLGSLTPGPNSTNPIAVDVSVPAGTPPGRYAVQLVAARDEKTFRTSTGAIVVPRLLGRIKARVKTQWRVVGALTKVLALRVMDVPAGATVSVKCRGKGCPFKRKRVKKSPSVNLAKSFRKRLRAGAKIEIRVTKPGYIGKLVRYRMRSQALPKAASLCVPLGATKARRRCP